MLTPNEAKQKAAPKEADLKKLEKIIDETIVRGLVAGLTDVHIKASIFPNSITMQTIMSNYRIAGWNVRYESSQTDGDYLTFKEKHNTYSYPYDR